MAQKMIYKVWTIVINYHSLSYCGVNAETSSNNKLVTANELNLLLYGSWQSNRY